MSLLKRIIDLGTTLDGSMTPRPTLHFESLKEVLRFERDLMKEVGEDALFVGLPGSRPVVAGFKITWRQG